MERKPLGIVLFYQIYFPLTLIALERLFTLNSAIHIVMGFKPDKPMDLILCSMFRTMTCLVVRHAAR